MIELSEKAKGDPAMQKRQRISIRITVLLLCALLVCGFCADGQSSFFKRNVSAWDGQQSLQMQTDQLSDIRLSGGEELYRDTAALFSGWMSSAGVREAVSGKREQGEHLLFGALFAAFLKSIVVSCIIIALFRAIGSKRQFLQRRILTFIHNQDGKKRSFSIF